MAQVYSRSQGKVIEAPEAGAMTTAQPTTQPTGNRQQMIQQAAIVDLLTTGGKNISKISTIGGLFPEEKPKELTEKERSYQQAAEAAAGALKTLRTGDVSTGPLTTPLQKLGQIVPGAKATPGTTYRSQIAFARTIVRNALLGGAITKQEAKSLESGLPTETDQEDISRQKLEDFISQFGGKYGVKVPAGEMKTKEKGPGLIESLISPYVKTARNIGAASILLPQAGAAGLASKFSPELGGEIASADILGTQKLGEEFGTGKSFTERMTSKGATEGYVAGAEVAIEGIIGKYAPTVANKIIEKSGINKVGSKLYQKAKGFFKPSMTKEELNKGIKLIEESGDARKILVEEAQVAGEKINGSNLFKSVETWANRAKRANPKNVNAIDSYVKAARTRFKGKILNPDTSLNLWEDASSGFTAAGKANKTVTAGYHRAIRDALRSSINEVAPGFAELTGQIRKGFELEKILKPVRTGIQRQEINKSLKSPISRLFTGDIPKVAAAAGGGAYLMRLLSGQGGGYGGGE